MGTATLQSSLQHPRSSGFIRVLPAGGNLRQTTDAGEASKGPGQACGQDFLLDRRLFRSTGYLCGTLAIDLSERLRTKLSTFVVSSSCSSLIFAFRVAHTLLFS